MGTYAARVEKLVERHVLSTLPELGSGEGLDLAALEAGLEALQARLDALAETVRRSAGATARRTAQHARSEVSRTMRVQVPYDARSNVLTDGFESLQVARLRKVGRDQVAKIREYVAKYEEGTSLRDRILHSLWVARNNSRTVAQTEVLRLHRDNVRYWCQVAGSEQAVYCTRHDELVRPTHAAHDGEVVSWSNPPSTLGEPNCRCQLMPLEALWSQV